MLRAFDCATPLNDALCSIAVDHGFQAVGRYYGSPGSGKLLTRNEAGLILGSGLAIFLYFERTAARVLAGGIAGAVDAQLALSQAAECGQPNGTGIAFAVDQDIPGGDAVMAAYFAAAKKPIKEAGYLVGVYGSGEVCSYLKQAGLADYTILAGAMGWRGSSQYRDSNLWGGLQYSTVSPQASPLGIAIDPVDLVSVEAVGAWPSQVATLPPPAGQDAGITVASVIQTAEKLQDELKVLGLYTGVVDGKVGPMTSAAAMRAWSMAQKG